MATYFCLVIVIVIAISMFIWYAVSTEVDKLYHLIPSGIRWYLKAVKTRVETVYIFSIYAWFSELISVFRSSVKEKLVYEINKLAIVLASLWWKNFYFQVLRVVRCRSRTQIRYKSHLRTLVNKCKTIYNFMSELDFL